MDKRSPYKEEKSATNRTSLGKFAKFDPGLFIYVRPVRGLQNYLCQAGWRSRKTLQVLGNIPRPSPQTDPVDFIYPQIIYGTLLALTR